MENSDYNDPDSQAVLTAVNSIRKLPKKNKLSVQFAFLSQIAKL